MVCWDGGPGLREAHLESPALLPASSPGTSVVRASALCPGVDGQGRDSMWVCHLPSGLQGRRWKLGDGLANAPATSLITHSPLTGGPCPVPEAPCHARPAPSPTFSPNMEAAAHKTAPRIQVGELTTGRSIRLVNCRLSVLCTQI